MSTERIYRTDPYATENEAVITSVREKNGCDEIACDVSVFFPEGGGQPSDKGTVSIDESAVFEVVRASDKDHVGDV